MSQPSAIERPGKRLWQFSIAHLLVAITLAAVTCGTFRLDIGLGILMLNLAAAIAITAVRTRAAEGHHEELWNVLGRPSEYRRVEVFHLAFNSFGVAIAALFFFYVGFAFASIVAIIILEGMSQGGPMGLLAEGTVLFLTLGAGILCSIWWLRQTWPRSFFIRTVVQSVPSEKTA